MVVRARVMTHLQAFHRVVGEKVASVKAAKIKTGGGTDYPFRIKFPAEDLADVMTVLGDSIDYDNFKSAIQDATFHDRLMTIWSVMRR